MAGAAADASLEPVLEELRRHPIDPEGPHPIAVAIRSGEMQIVPDISEQFRKEIAQSGAHYDALARWPAQSAVVAPLKARGKILGAAELASFSVERTYGAGEMSIISELMRRAANAVDNARLFEERSSLARTLQQSFLPPRLPEVPGAEFAARFQPAAGVAEVGGDFYEVFPAEDDAWTIIVGDVAGRGVEAATGTAIARHTARAAAIHGSSLVRILSMINQALYLQLHDSRFCTAVVGLLKIDGAGARLRVASAGHPLPLLLRPDGSVEPIGGKGALLGVLRDPDFAEEEVELRPGETVIFYTNGVSEIRAPHELEDLTTLVGTCVDLDATATAECIDQAIREMRPAGDLQDDALILVLRIVEGVGQAGTRQVPVSYGEPARRGARSP
jgi:serine phosphatase RsbU (regulator of sigma subunit)